MQPVKTSTMFNKQRGMTLLELVVVLTITAVLAAATLQFSGGMRESVAFQQTQERVQSIKNAIINVQTVNGVPVVSGFVADIGRLPYCLQELLIRNYTCPSNSGSDPTWGSVIGSCVTGAGTTYVTQANCLLGDQWTPTLGSGWNGPYLQTSNNPTNDSHAYTDGWGNDIVQPPAVATATCSTLLPDNNSYCTTPDIYNYGWNYLLNNPSAGQLTLQSAGSDKLLGKPILSTPVTSSNQYQFDYPASPSQPVINQQNWAFDISNSGAGVGVTVNLQANGNAYIQETSANPASLCGLAGGTNISSGGVATACYATNDMCTVIGGIWTTATATTNANCVLSTTPPLQTFCTNIGGSWNTPVPNACVLTMDLVTCSQVGGVIYSPTQCTLTGVFSSSFSLSDTCTLLGGSYLAPNCTLTAAATSSSATPAPTQIPFNNLCNVFNGASAWNTSTNTCTFTAPFLQYASGRCQSASPPSSSAMCTINTGGTNVCLNIFYRYNTNIPPSTDIAVASWRGTVTSDGNNHSISFSGNPSAAYDLTAVTPGIIPLTPPFLIPAGQNTISITQADVDGTCAYETGGITVVAPWNNSIYPATHSLNPILQMFQPGMPLVFNW